MDDLGALLMLLSFVGTIVGIVGLIKGNIKLFKLSSRKQVGLFILGCFVIFIIGGMMIDTGETDTLSTVGENIVQVERPDDTEGATETAALSQDESEQEEAQTAISDESPTASGTLEVHFIDVGQADSILIKAPSGTMLIDAGNNADADLVKSYIKNQGISKLDVVVGTHPHEDHIGGLDAVIDTFDIGKVYMSKVAHTTQTFEDVLIAIQNKGLKITAPIAGATFNVGEAKCTILAPNSNNYDDLNNYSIVIKVDFGETSFLFTGDAEDVSEKEMLSKGYDLAADVLKIGHHGSDSSTTQAFIDAINPKYAVIMVGKDNSYGHPHKTVMDRLKTENITVYRTDENGHIIATSDGINITFNTEPGSYSGSSESGGSGGGNGGGGGGSTSSISQTPSSAPAPTPTTQSTTIDRTVYWTPKGKSYHYTPNCPTLSRSKTILEGPLSQCPKYDPCDRCTY